MGCGSISKLREIFPSLFKGLTSYEEVHLDFSSFYDVILHSREKRPHRRAYGSKLLILGSAKPLMVSCHKRI